MHLAAIIKACFCLSMGATSGQFLLDLHPALLVVMISLGLSLVVAVVDHLVLDIKKLKNDTREIQLWQSERLKAVRANDRKLLEKVNKRKPQIDKLQLDLMKQRMKPTLIFFIPFWMLFVFLSGHFGVTIVAKLPFYLPWFGDSLQFAWWYFIASMGTFPIMQRVMGVSANVE